jgi:hypothetical protein
MAGVLFARIVGFVLGAMVVVALIRGNTGVEGIFRPIVSETRYLRAKYYDHVLYVVVVLIGVAALASWRARILNAAVTRWICIALASVGIAVGIFAVEEPHLVVTDGRWGGFGPGEFLAVVCLAPVLWYLFEWTRLPQWIRRVTTIVVVIGSVGDLATVYRPSFMVGTWGLNDAYTVNEMLAQSAGNVPDHAFIPQYETLYGWILQPFSTFMSVGSLSATASDILAIATYAGILGAVVLVYRLFERRSIALALLFTVPLTVVSVANNTLNNTVGAYQELPVRIAPPIILAALSLEALVKVRAGESRWKSLVPLGVAAAIVAWSNQDFCLVAVFAMALLFAMSSTARFGGPRRTAPWFLGLIGGLVMYPLILALIGSPISFHFLFFFQTLFGKQGYLNYPIQLPGPVLAVLPICISAAVTGLFAMGRRKRSSDSPHNRTTDRAAVTAAFFGIFCSGSLAYYISQSVATGPLEALLLPLGIALAASVVLLQPWMETSVAGSRQLLGTVWRNGALRPILPAGALGTGMYFLSGSVLASIAGSLLGYLLAGLVRLYWEDTHHKPIDGHVRQPWVIWMGLLPLTLAASLPIAALVQSPNPYQAVKVLIHPPPKTSIPWAKVDGVVQARDLARREHLSLQYYGAFGNYVQLASGVKPVALVNVPPAAPDNRKPTSTDCEYLAAHPSSLLVVDVGTAAIYGRTICGNYSQTTNRIAEPYSIYTHK